ncbi:CBS domain-containing protein [Ferribacterium limneticum]|jgi:CBS domain-containing protein|uniref:CBS domain-containing protein n=1 Tax=Ferribacterium limneticum TaxID=76259 RepID=UPI001CFBDAF6|nr:CBS domain-containing protein [Ferribacterium limneticum]UCV17632.1 CBS domain-containing protein [Ferribacterium limneticum]
MPNRLVSEVIKGRPFPTTVSGTTVREAAIIMKEWHSSAILIVDNGVLAGICTERDIVFRAVANNCDPANTAVSTIMTRNIQTVGLDKPFGHALHLMYEGGFRHIPVVDEAGHPVGLLAAHDALDMDGLQMEQDLVRREEITVIL